MWSMLMIGAIRSNYYYNVLTPDSVSEKAAVGLISASFFGSKVLGTGLTAAYLAYKWTHRPADRPLVYHPASSHTSPPSEAAVSPFRSGSTIGIVMAENVESKALEPVVVTQTTEHDRSGQPLRHHFNIFDRNDQMLGRAVTFPYEQDAALRIYTTRSAAVLEDCPTSYYGKAPMIRLDRLYNTSKTHKSIGYYLVKAILQWYKTHYSDQFGGRMDLAADYNAHSFYYKLGFRSDNPVVNVRSKQALDFPATCSDTSALAGNMMYLPPASIAEWDKEIERHPIRMPG